MGEVRDATELFLHHRPVKEERGPDIEPGIYMDPSAGEMITVFAGADGPGIRSARRLPARFKLFRRFEMPAPESRELPKAA